MPPRLHILHITTHLGGGIGRVLSGLAAHNRGADSGVEEVFICLQTPRDTRHADAIAASGARLLIAPDTDRIKQEIARADIVQLDWWQHPLMARLLAEIGAIAARWVVWAHTSGLHYPIITPAFAALPHAFVTTTPATLAMLDRAGAGRDNIVDYVSSTGGFDDFPPPPPRNDGRVRCGYLGSLNAAKLHPNVMDFIDAIDRPDLRVDFYGDSSVNPVLEKQVRERGAQSSINLQGFCAQPQDILPWLDIFIYPLNPTHYGTTENALLEAMACGAVPVVLNNPIESGIVRHNVTGMVADGPHAFAEAVRFLLDHPDERRRMSLACLEMVRHDFPVAQSAAKLNGIYRAVAAQEKKPVDFSAIFGITGAEMFLSCLGDYASCFTDADSPAQRARRLALPFLYEKSKSSAFQFLEIFPDDEKLARYAAMLEADKAAS